MSSLIAECYRRLTDSSAGQQPLKGYKVTDVNRTRKIGVACRSLLELKRKACAKFNITDDLSEIGIFLLDGSEIDEDYFTTLEPQTTLILRRPGEKLLTEADVLYQMLRRVNESFFQNGERAEAFLTDKLKVKIASLNKALNAQVDGNNDDDSKTLLSTQAEHPEWFDGLDTRARTKEAYLHRRCQDRVRSYLYKTIEQIRTSDEYNEDPAARKRLQRVIAFFKLQLKKDHYFGFYFDRSCAARNEDVELNNSQEATDDEIDGSQVCRYEHCPCKMSISSYERYILGLDDIDDDEAKNEDSDSDGDENDEVDAKKAKMTPQKDREGNLIGSDRDELQEAEAKCQYKIVTRRKQEMRAMCDEKGEFSCNGVWNLNRCAYDDRHRINPYRSKEELVLFSTWNLDHKIERSRTIVPQLLEASRKDQLAENEVREFYDNLFTAKNLRLVHIVCHDKSAHK